VLSWSVMVFTQLVCCCTRRVGTAQNWASDWGSFPLATKGNVLTSDADQVWLDVNAAAVRTAMSQVGV
jgi:hypothetical protein